MPNSYDSLLLSCGGGIINTKQQSPQDSQSAALAIGIGGTGVAALAALKRKVYQQLEPDNPDDPVPEYKHIQFMAIDSDESDIARMRGKGRLDKDSEFFSIKNPSLSAALTQKNLIKGNPRLNWMDIDNIDSLLTPDGAGGIRQIGRYLLISKAPALKTKIQLKCNTALSGMPKASLNVYIFAGISGGTGSGCFIDTCYIVRQVLKEQGWNASSRIMGFFFLPDVVISKPPVAADASSVKYNSSNGYAAMKELDYLMDLKCANDRFHQNYGEFVIDTQEPPVDMCHLISASRADGSILNDGFSYGINVASDYVIAYLANVQMPEGLDADSEEKGLTMRGHLANVTTGVSGLGREHGANLSYHILGASTAEIPMTQISTYLAAGFYGRFDEAVGTEHKIPKDEVDKFMSERKITAKDIIGAAKRGIVQLQLPEIERTVLRGYCPLPKGTLPMPWATSRNDWLDKARGTLERNCAAMGEDLPKIGRYNKANISEDSLIGRVFLKLFELAVDPNYGPYYAARLLKCEGYDLISAVKGIIKELEENKKTQELYYFGHPVHGGGAQAELEQIGTDFYHRSNKKNYERFIELVERECRIEVEIISLGICIAMMRKFEEKLTALSNDFFGIFRELLDRLKETFKENGNFLNSPLAQAPNAYTWRIFELEDVKEHLDKVIAELTPKQIIEDFIGHLLNSYEEWIGRDENKIAKCISDYMVNMSTFSQEVNRSLEGYLYTKYPNVSEGDVTSLATEVRRDIITRVDDRAMPMFWCDPVYDIDTKTFKTSSISVPNKASAVCTAADQFAAAATGYVVRKTGLNNRIFASRFCSGVPFYAYKGTTLLRQYYDGSVGTSYGNGAHLYSKTNRGDDVSGLKDWRNFLPVPTAYSLEPETVPDGDKKMALYNRGETEGIIVETETKDYAILQSEISDIPDYKPADFIKNAEFNIKKWDEVKSKLEKMLADMRNPDNPNVKRILLRNDGIKGKDMEAIIIRVRKDYFLHYPMLQKIVRDELEKQAKINAELEKLQKIRAEHEKYMNDMDSFCNLIFFVKIKCISGEGYSEYNQIKSIYYNYNDSMGAEQTLNFLEEIDESSKLNGKCPLYLAFKNYRRLNPEETPRSELDETLNDHKGPTGIKVGKGDNVVAYMLESIWTPRAIAALKKEIEFFGTEMQENIMNFYSTMVRHIAKFKTLFSIDTWQNTDVKPEGWLAPVIESPKVETPKVFTLWDTQQQAYLYVYEQHGLNRAYAQNRGWVALNPQTMLLYNEAAKSWDKLQLDAGGNIIIR